MPEGRPEAVSSFRKFWQGIFLPGCSYLFIPLEIDFTRIPNLSGKRVSINRPSSQFLASSRQSFFLRRGPE
jgi:hypothetical protein